MMYNFVRNDLKNNWRKQICKWNLFILDKIGKALSMVEGFSSELRTKVSFYYANV
jgi:hypothetical protein